MTPPLGHDLQQPLRRLGSGFLLHRRAGVEQELADRGELASLPVLGARAVRKPASTETPRALSLGAYRHRSSVVELSIRNPARPAPTGAGRRVYNDLRKVCADQHQPESAGAGTTVDTMSDQLERSAMEPFKNTEEAQRFLLKSVYEYFRQKGEWPRARDFDLEHGDLFDLVGGIELVSRQLGTQKITPATPANNSNDQVRVLLRGLAEIDEARDDIEKFLEAVRLAARKYRESRGSDSTLKVGDVAALPGVDVATAKRVVEIFGLAPVVSSGGSSDQWNVHHEIRRFANVQTLDDFFVKVKESDERGRALAEHAAAGLRSVGQRPQQSHQPKRVFLSHASDDAVLALHLANVIRQDAGNIHVFVASRAGDIPPGAAWLEAIERELRTADTYVLLLTPGSVKRFWLAFESGAAWMSQRAFIPLTAAGLRKGDVPYPLGSRQALSLEEHADVEQLAKDLGITIPDVATFCATVQQLSKALPASSIIQFVGVALDDSFFDWAGPLHKLDDIPGVPESVGLINALRAAGAEPSFRHSDGEDNQRAKGLLPVYETDRQTWKRKILYSADGEQILFVRPPSA